MQCSREFSSSFITIAATDADGDNITYGISGGADQSKFIMVTFTGDLFFTSSPNYENPNDVGTNNTYVVDVTASDGTSTDVMTLTVTVTNVNEAPTDIAAAGTSISESASVGASVTNGTLSETDVDAGDTHTYSS